jgi:hypothetical protein
VGIVGTIKEVPVHPITWFKIEFPSGQIATFRPSAFKLDDGRDDDIIPRPPKKTTTPAVYKVKEVAPVSKDTESQLALGMRVRIRSGELTGSIGEIMRFGNGWIQVLTAEGKIAKRAHEIDCIDTPSNLALKEFHFSGDNIASSDLDIKRSKSGRVIRSHPQYTPTQGDHGNSDSQENKNVKRQSSNPDNSMVIDGSLPSQYLQRQSHPCVTSKKSKGNLNLTFRSSQSDCFDLEHQSVDCPYPLISLKLRQANRKNTQQYVDRESSFNSNTGRPDLSYWLDQIRGVFSEKREMDGDNLVYDSSLIDGFTNDAISNSHYGLGDNSMSDVNIVEEQLMSPTALHAVSTMRSFSSVFPSQSLPDISHYSHAHISEGMKTEMSAPQRTRSDSLAETDSEEEMSPELSSLPSFLVSMPTSLLLPPPDKFSAQTQTIAALYDHNTAELSAARFFLSSSTILTPRDGNIFSLQSAPQQISPQKSSLVPDLKEWANIFSNDSAQIKLTDCALKKRNFTDMIGDGNA